MMDIRNRASHIDPFMLGLAMTMSAPPMVADDGEPAWG